MAEDLEIGGSEQTGAEQNLQTLDALHLDGKGAPTLEDADERSLVEAGDTRPEDVTGNANVQSAGRTTYEQMVQGGVNEQPVVPTGDNVAVDTVNPTFRDNTVAARFDNVQPTFNPGVELPDPERRPERDEPTTLDPETLVTRDPVALVRGEDAPQGTAGAAAAAATPEEEVAAELPPTATPQPSDDEVLIPKVADAPSVVVAAASGTEDRDTKLNIAIATADQDGGSETISAITIGNVPAGFSFVDAAGNVVGIDNGNGTWSFTQNDLSDLYLRQPEDYSGDISLTVSAISQESNGSTATTTTTLSVHVEAVADAPGLDVADAAGMENALIPLTITVGNNDAMVEGSGANAPETQLVYISDLPEDATLFLGDAAHPVVQQVGAGGLTIGTTHIPAGAYVVAAADLPNLMVRSASNDSHDFTLSVWATSTEASNGEVAVVGFQTIEVDVGVNAPSVDGSGSAREGAYAELDLSASVNYPDGSEELRVFVADLPDGAELLYRDGSAVPVNSDGRYEVTGRLDDLKVGWLDSDSDTDISFNVVAEVRDGDSDSDSDTVKAAAPDFAATTTPVTVTIQAVADGPTSLSASGIGVEDQWFHLDISTALADPDSETLSVIVTGPAGFLLADAADTDHPYQGVTSADGSTVTYTLTQDQLATLQMRAAADSDTDIDLTITATGSETGPETGAAGEVAVASASKTLDLNVKILSDADKPVVSVVKDTQIIGEDGLFDLSKSVKGTFNDGDFTHAAVTGASAESGSAQGADASGDGSETITYRITANQDSRVSFDHGANSRVFAEGETITVSAEDIRLGNVQLGGPTDWASSSAQPTLTFTVVTVATEAADADDDALQGSLVREGKRVSDPATLTIAVDPSADVATARLAVVASGYEDGLSGFDHTAGAIGDGIAVVPTLTLTDADLSESPTGVVTITSDDAAMIAGTLTIDGADIVRTNVTDAAGKVVSSTWTITGGDFTTTADNTFRLDGLVFHPAADSDADPTYDISVQFQDTDGGTTATVAATDQTITVTAVADKPLVGATDTSAWESASGDRIIDLDISATRGADTDGSESLFVYVTDLPSTSGSLIGDNVATYTSGTVAGLTASTDNPVYRIPAADLDSLKLKLGQGVSTDVVLKVVSTSVEQSGDEAISTPTTLRVDVGVLDPVISGNFAVSGNEDANISLSSVSVAVTAAGDHETRTVYVEAPAGVTLYDGTGVALHRIEFTDANGDSHSGFDVSEHLNDDGSLNVSARNDDANSDANVSLKVFAIVADADADASADAGGIDLGTAYGDEVHDTAMSVATIAVTVNAVADTPDTPTLNAVGVEDKWVALDFTSVSLADTDGSETLTVTLSDIPAGLTVESANPLVRIVQVDATTWAIGPAESAAEMTAWLTDADLRLTGLSSLDEDANAPFTIKVSATATDSGDDGTAPVSSTSAVGSVTVTLYGDADKPGVDVLKGATEATAETVGEDGLYNFKDVIQTYSGEDADDVISRLSEAYGAKSADGSETLTLKITVQDDCIVKVGSTVNTLSAGQSVTVTAAQVLSGSVQVGGRGNWASANADDLLQFDLTPVATESDSAASTTALNNSNAVNDEDLTRSASATGDTRSFYLYVAPNADSARISVSASGLEDADEIAIAPTIKLNDTDGSEHLQGTVDIMVRCDANGAYPGDIVSDGTTMIDGGVETYGGQTYHVYKVPVAELTANGGNSFKLDGLNFVPDADSDLDIQYRIRATTAEAGNTSTYATVSSLTTLTVSAVADAPVLTVGAPGATTDTAGEITVHDHEDGGADRIVRLDLGARVADRDGSEVLTNAELREVPEGWGVITVDKDGNKVSALVGTDSDHNGTYTFVLDPALFSSTSTVTVALVPPANSDVDATDIVFWAKSTEVTGSAGHSATDTQVAVQTKESSVTLNVQLDPVADTPVLNVANARGSEDHSVALDIRAAVTDADEAVSLVITGVPDGGVLTYTNADRQTVTVTFGGGVGEVESLTCSADEARTLRFTAPDDASGRYTLTVTAIATDTDPEDPSVSNSTTRTATIDVTVKGVNDAILDRNGVVVDANSGVLTATGTEDHLVNLGLGTYSVDDVDGSETLSAVIQGLPSGVSLVVKVGDTIIDTADALQYIGKDASGQAIWSVSQDYLQYVHVRTPANYADDFDLTVRLVTTEKDGAATAVDKTLTVTVAAQADAPSVSVSANVDEDNWGLGGIPVEITVRPSDTTTESPEHISQITIDVDLPEGLNSLRLRFGDQTVSVGGDAEFTIKEGDALWKYYDTATGKLSVTVLDVPSGWSTDIPLTVSATSTDINGTTAVSTTETAVVINAVADIPTWSLGAGASYSETATGTGGYLPNIDQFGHAISNVVLYIEKDGAVLRVKIDNFSDVHEEHGYEMYDVNNLDVEGFIEQNYAGGTLVGIAVKAGNNSDGQGEGVLTVLDSRYTQSTLQPDTNTPFTREWQFIDLYEADSTHSVVLTTPNNLGGTTSTVGSWSGAGKIGQAVDLGLDLTFNDPDNSESVYFIVSGVPNGVVLNHGYNNGDGTWTVLYDESDANWTLTATASFSGQATLTVTPILVDDDPDGDDDTLQLEAKTFNLVVTNASGGVDTWPTPTLTAPTLGGSAQTGTEGESFDLGGVSASATSGTLSAVVLLDLPDNAKVVGTTDEHGNTIAWYNPLKGTWTIDPNHLDDFKVAVQEDMAGTVTLDLRAVAVSGAQTATSATTSVAVVTLAPETDGASLSATPGSVIEDGGSIAFALTVKDNEVANFSETLVDGTITVTIGAVKGTAGQMHLPGSLKTGTIDGMVVSEVAGSPGTYTIRLTPTQIAGFNSGSYQFTVDGLEFVPDSNYSGSVGISFSTRVQDTGSDIETSTGSVTLTVVPAVDSVGYSAGISSGNEDVGVALNLVINHQDVSGTGHWGSETVSVVISGVPEGAIIEGATNNGPTTVNGVTTTSWTIERSSAHLVASESGITLKDVKYVSPTDDSSDVTLTVTTYVFEKGVSEPTSTSSTITVGVNGVTDGVTINPNDASGREDEMVAIDLGAQLVDITGSSEVVYVTLTGVPAGSSFFAADGGAVGEETASGTWRFSTDEVEALGLLDGGKVYLTGPLNVSGNWTLTAQAVALDTDGATAVEVASNALSFTVTLASVADAPTLTVAGGVTVAEDGQAGLGIHAALVDVDSESLSVTITGAPDGTIIRVNTGTEAAPVWKDFSGENGVWTIPAGTATSLDTLTVKPPADYNGSFTLSVTASSTEADGGSAWSAAPKLIAVKVEAANDAPTASVVGGGVGVEQGAHSAPIYLLGAGASVAFSDIDFQDAGASATLSQMSVSIGGGPASDSLGLSNLAVTLNADGVLVCHPDSATTVAISYDPVSHTLTFSGDATPAQYAELAKHVVISSTDGTLAAGTREVTITAYDGAGEASAAAGAMVTVTVNGTGASLIGAALGDVAFDASGTAILPADSITTSEDATPFVLDLDMADRLSAGMTASISGMPDGTVFHDADGHVVDAGAVTSAQLSSLTVTLPQNWNGNAALTVTANAGGTLLTETVAIAAAAVNDAPSLGIDATSQTVEASAGIVSSPIHVIGSGATVGATDVDGTVTGMTVQLLADANGDYAAGDTLGLYGYDIALNASCDLVIQGTDITVSYDSADHTLTFSGSDDSVSYADLAKAVVLSSTELTLATGTRSFRVTLYDDGNAASHSVDTTVDVSNGSATAAGLSQDAHGTIYWDASTPVLNGSDSSGDTIHINVGTELSVNGNGGTDTLTFDYHNGGWTFEVQADEMIHVVSTDGQHDGIIHLNQGVAIEPFANGAHDVVFNGSASGSITFDNETVVSFTNLEKLHG